MGLNVWDRTSAILPFCVALRCSAARITARANATNDLEAREKQVELRINSVSKFGCACGDSESALSRQRQPTEEIA
jgi:hypothetical protein